MSPITSNTPTSEVGMKKIFSTWWPLAASWMLMSLEMPALSAVIARMVDPEINLAAYGGIVFPLALIIEAPIIMLLAASTALSKDWTTYSLVRRFMMGAGALLSLLHVLIAFTPLYYFVVQTMLNAPPEIIEPGRIGLQIMLPWTWSIAYRRFHQGVLIRFGHSKYVGMGTIIRLSTNILVLLFGFFSQTFSGIVVATSAVATGVLSEAAFTGLVTRPVLKNQVASAPKVSPNLTWREFYRFYIPLAMTSLLTLLANPIGSAALNRMPKTLASLAVWPVVSGLIFMLRSFGIAFNEVVVAMLDISGSSKNLLRFTLLLSIVTSAGLLLITITPLSEFWFSNVIGLEDHLLELGKKALWLALPLPALSTLQSWYQGNILHSQETRGITEAVVIYLVTSILVLGAGVLWGKPAGLFVALASLSISVGTQTLWLWVRYRQGTRRFEL